MYCPDGGRAVGAALLACVLFAPAPNAAGADPARTATRGQTAVMSGSDRLRIFAWGKWLETGQAPREIVDAMQGALVRQGFYHDGPEAGVVWTDVRAAPLLGFDTNINGGVAQDSFTFAGFTFEAAPEVRAVSGIVAGLEGGGTARLAWDTGRTVEISANGTYGWAPGRDLSYYRGTLQLCSRNTVVGWIFADGCVAHAVSERDLASQRLDRASLTLSTLFETPAAWHELSGELAVTRTDTVEQTTATVTLGSVWDLAVTEASLTVGDPVAGITGLDHRVAVDIRWQAGGYPTGIGLWQSASSGGRFLGVPRADTATGITAFWQARPGLSVEVGYSVVNSTADLFDDESVTFQVRLDDPGF